MLIISLSCVMKCDLLPDAQSILQSEAVALFAKNMWCIESGKFIRKRNI
jgi:hypothetical protein